MFFGLKNAEIRKGRRVAPSFAFLFVMAWMLCGIFSLTGCDAQTAPDREFVDAFVDMRVVELSYGASSPLARLLRQETLRKYGYTREQFLAETEKLLANENAWVPFQKAVVARVDSLLAGPQAAAAPGRAVDVPPLKGGAQ